MKAPTQLVDAINHDRVSVAVCLGPWDLSEMCQMFGTAGHNSSPAMALLVCRSDTLVHSAKDYAMTTRCTRQVDSGHLDSVSVACSSHHYACDNCAHHSVVVGGAAYLPSSHRRTWYDQNQQTRPFSRSPENPSMAKTGSMACICTGSGLCSGTCLRTQLARTRIHAAVCVTARARRTGSSSDSPTRRRACIMYHGERKEGLGVGLFLFQGGYLYLSDSTHMER
ncbi:hypothetical protein F4819DRAFT_27420 [Hypoxylon fuscum]|nr:hypothetical protein F4819DRAFT_27420 [Hypoxylon fuscum]